ncbi:hypothetical protein H4W32_002087 [Actinophytocola algeriensis]|uniref:Uncharacterized protein n=1 Tax=Actinophytocola algeriensis TaxID=1768010 RepID=A0A7W7VI07_9PSEU|nr:hypothetical protein [Actinophytocola algeriensis]MBB4911052.1 hypothetical protein [Actinophytocola algeriensis]MBE1474045.1 hypothetical protein [Actinophytocola algeriensis]
MRNTRPVQNARTLPRRSSDAGMMSPLTRKNTMMPYLLVLNSGISSRRNSAMKAYDEWSNTTTSAAMPRNASSQPDRAGCAGPIPVWTRFPRRC